MIDLVPGKVTVASPLECQVDGGDAGSRTAKVGTWTPTVNMRVLIAVDARTRAKLYCFGPLG